MSGTAESGRSVAIADKAKRDYWLSKIVPLIEHGMTQEKACQGSGIALTTYFRYKRTGLNVVARLSEMQLTEPDDSFDATEKACWIFWSAISLAEIQCLDRNLLAIQVATQTQWQAAAWWIERRFPNDYSKTTKIEHSGNEENPVCTKEVGDKTREALLRSLSDADRLKILEAQRIMRVAAKAISESEDEDEVRE